MEVRLQFEGIRCFSEPQDAVVRPLTILVGENSSGKTTFLALNRLGSAIIAKFDQEMPFNEAPFFLGAYDQIASDRGGRNGGAKSFSIAVNVREGSHDGSIRADFVSREGLPWLRTWRLEAGELSWRFDEPLGNMSLLLESPRGRKEISNLPPLRPLQLLSYAPEAWASIDDAREIEALFPQSAMSLMRKTLHLFGTSFGWRDFAFAPIRTNPQRTYDPVSAEAKPEGSHVPMLLAQLSHPGNKKQWGEIKSALHEFGSNSGLFDQIEVVRKGKKESDPFQIGVNSGGPAFNLVDVGYGVSQALPIVVETLLRSTPIETLLIQQPEVHLHPRAQAELGSFFARQVSKTKRFVIETHSDYLVDRVRMEVRRGSHIRPEDVSLLYFERQKGRARIHNIELDKNGTIVNPPPGFREFFLNEELALLDV